MNTPRAAPLLVFLSTFMGPVSTAQQATPDTDSALREPPLRVAESSEDVVSDLTRFVPSYLADHDIPGAAVALVRDGRVAWSKGFGVTNSITHQLVTSETLFEVASNSKVIAAYTALRLVDQGVLSLDEPLNKYLADPWLPPSEYRDAVTLRHVLSHSSGLGHNTLGRDVNFPPGTRYSYSGIGYQYLQEVIEHVTGKPLEEVAREMVFEPLGMSSSSFVNRADLTDRTSNGHLRATVPVLLFAVSLLASLIVVGSIGLVVERLRTGGWRPTRVSVVVILTIVFVVSLAPAFYLFSSIGMLEFAWLIAFCALMATGIFICGYLPGRVMIRRLALTRPWARIVLMVIWSALVLVVIYVGAASLTNLPVPRWPDARPMASATLRATVGDMSAFLIEISHPQLLSPEMAAELQRPQVRLSDDLSWGLGPGIQHSMQGNALWQWGQNIDFQSIMIIYPAHRFGVVVCTNNDLFSPDAARDIAHRALGGKIDAIIRGMHLEYNYSGDD